MVIRSTDFRAKLLGLSLNYLSTLPGTQLFYASVGCKMRLILVPPSQGLGEDKRTTSKCLEPCWAQMLSVNTSHYYYVITVNLFLYCTGYLVDHFNLETQTFTVGTSACIISFVISFHFLHTFFLESLLSIKFPQCYISIHWQSYFKYSIFLSYFLNMCMYVCVYLYIHTHICIFMYI